jgi:predicted AAA+ superfamily ATPase
MWRRLIEDRLRQALADTPCVVVNGPRQSGKTTLVRDLLPEDGWRSRYLSLDDATTLAAASSDPGSFVEGLDGPHVIDEVQRAPALLRAIKASVDRDRSPGRFVLTGSADVLTLPKVATELAGRAEIVTLWPLAQAEIEGTRGTFVDDLLEGRPRESSPCDMREVHRRVAAGGYPEPVGRSGGRRRSWFESYITLVLQRDVREISHVQHVA